MNATRLKCALRLLLLTAMLCEEHGLLTAQGNVQAAVAPVPGQSAVAETSNEAANFKHARAVADDVLKRPEFQRDLVNSWWENKKLQLGHALERIFGRMARLGHAAPWLAKVLEWTLFGGAALGLLLFVMRELRRQRLHVSLSDGTVKAEAWTREAGDWAARAEAFAREAAWREAVHCLYWAAIVLLESRRAWKHNPTRTPREYVRLLRAGSPQQQGLRGLTQIFERTWYGLRETDGEEYGRARGFYDALLRASSVGTVFKAERAETQPLNAEGL